jgi:hypothetical protein
METRPAFRTRHVREIPRVPLCRFMDTPKMFPQRHELCLIDLQGEVPIRG